MNDTLTSGTALIAKNIFDNNFKIELNWRVADLGCGTMAFFSIEAARRVGSKGLVYAVDIQKQVLATVNQLAKTQGFYNIETIWSDVEIVGATMIENESCDAVLLVTTLYQLTDKASAIKEAIRLLKSNGHLLIIDWRTNNAPIAPESSRLVDVNKLKDVINNSGMEIVNEFEPTNYHFGMVVKKPLANN